MKAPISQMHKDIPFASFCLSSIHAVVSPIFTAFFNTIPIQHFLTLSSIFPQSPLPLLLVPSKEEKMSEFSFSNFCKSNKIQSSSVLSHSFNIFFFIFLSPYLLRLLPLLSPLLFTTVFLLSLFPPNLVHENDDSQISDSKFGFLLSVVESLVRKMSSKNDENDEGIRYYEEFQTYLDVFRAPIFEVLQENCSEPGYPGEEGRESRAHVVPMEKRPNGNFDENPFGKDDDGKVEAAGPIIEENMFFEKECNEVLEENYIKSGYSGDDGRESRNPVGPLEKEPNVTFDENPFEEDNGKPEAARPIAGEKMSSKKECREILEENFPESDCSSDAGRGHVGLMEDPTVNLEEKPAGEDDDVDKVEKNTKLEDMFCQKRDKEVKPLDTHPNKADGNKEKMALRSGSKVVCHDSIIDAKDSASNSEEEYFGTPERNWDYNRSYGSMRKEKEWRRTLACKLYEERNNVDDGSEAMDLLWETYEDTEPDKAKGSTKSEDNDGDNDDEEEEEEEAGEKEKGMEGKYCCLQALKLSAGKMNLGMRKPSLVKISKALKSIGLLHHVSKHGRKKLH